MGASSKEGLLDRMRNIEKILQSKHLKYDFNSVRHISTALERRHLLYKRLGIPESEVLSESKMLPEWYLEYHNEKEEDRIYQDVLKKHVNEKGFTAPLYRLKSAAVNTVENYNKHDAFKGIKGKGPSAKIKFLRSKMTKYENFGIFSRDKEDPRIILNILESSSSAESSKTIEDRINELAPRKSK